MQRMHLPAGPVVTIPPSSAGGWSSVRGWGIKTPHASGPKPQTIKQKQYCNKVNKDFKNCLHQRILKNKKNICGGTSNEE